MSTFNTNIVNKISLFMMMMIITAGSVNAFEATIGEDKIKEAKNSYIFVFNDDVPASRVPAIASEMAKAHAATVRATFKHVFKGFSANISAQAAEQLAGNPAVKYYEQNGVASITVMPDVVAERVKSNGNHL